VLTATPIEVCVEGGTVELRGEVADLEQRRRAVELARSTLGVEQVIDSLTVPAPQP
jgi:osmotically-inducible protein OsmY